MSTLAIELNDAGILAASATLVSPPSPACAILKEPNLLIGEIAYEQARLHPRDANHLFWHHLRLEAMERPLAGYQTHADLAYAHLMQLYKPYREAVTQVVFAIPGSFSQQQLGLLLGICQRADIPVKGLVDTAIAGVTHPVPGNRMIVLDANNHCVLLNELIVDNGLRHAQLTRIDNFGLADFYSRWASFVSDAFVKNTRFDPMHSAQSEQWLYDSMPSFIDQINGGKDSVVFASSDNEYTTAIERHAFIAAVAGLYQPVVNAITAKADSSTVTSVIISHRMASLPGLVTLIEQHPNFRVVSLEQHAVTQAILANPDYFVSSQDKFSLVKQKPWQATPSLVASGEDGELFEGSENIRQPSHVLIDTQAYVLGDESFIVGTSLPSQQWGYQVSGVVKGVSRQHCSIVRRAGHIYLDDKSTYGTYVNGKRVKASHLLHVGDRIQIGNPGIEIRIIEQVKNNGKT